MRCEGEGQQLILRRVLYLAALRTKLVVYGSKTTTNEMPDLEMETKPEDVLAEIHRLQAIELSQR